MKEAFSRRAAALWWRCGGVAAALGRREAAWGLLDGCVRAASGVWGQR